MAIKHKTVVERGDLLTSTMWNEEHVIEDFTIKGIHIDNEQIGTDHLINGSVTEEKLASASVSPAKLKADNSPSEGYVPSYAAATGNFLWIPLGFRLIKKVEVDSDTGTMVIDGLNLPSDGFYLIFFHIRNKGDVSNYYYMYPNGNTAMDYEAKGLKWDGSNVTTEYKGFAMLGRVAADWSFNAVMHMWLQYAGGGIYNWKYTVQTFDDDENPITWSGRNVTGGITSVTSLEIWSGEALGIKAGSYALVFGYRE